MSAYVSALAILAVASLLGAGVLRACSREPWSPLAPAVGLGVLVTVSGTLIRLPGDARTLAVLLCLAAVAAAVLVVRSDGIARPAADVAAALAVVAVGTALPFLANGEIGLPGAGVNNDMASHLAWAEDLRHPGGPVTLAVSAGYPLSPHALVASVAEGLGVSMDMAFTGLLLAITAATALCALGLLSGLGRATRGLAAGLVSLAYLTAAYYGQGAFKETLTGLFLLLFVAALTEVSRERRVRVGHVVVAAVAAGGSFTNYSYFGLAWIVLTLVLWAAAEALRPDGRISARALWSSLTGFVTASRRSRVLTGAGALVVAVLLVPEIVRSVDFFRQVSLSPTGSGTIGRTQLGNLVGELSPFQALGLWPEEDFRRYFEVPREAYRAGLAAGAALAALGLGLWWHLRRRLPALPAAAVAAGAIYLYLKGGESPYVTAKALVVPAPILACLMARGLLDRGSAPLGPATILRIALAVGVGAVAAWSSFLVLRGSAVWPSGHRSELARLRPLVQGKEVLYLAPDEFAYWELRGAHVSEVSFHTPPPEITRRAKRPYAQGRPADFDTLTPAALDSVDRVITPSGHAGSEAPANFSIVRRTRSFALWRRRGPTPRRHVLNEGAAPGAILRCDRAPGRRLSRRLGWARVRPKPVSEPGQPGNPIGPVDVEGLPPGGRSPRTIVLAPGRYELSMTYSAPRPPLLRLEGVRTFEPPAQVDRIGPRWPIGTFSWRGGPLEATFEIPRMRLGAERQDTLLGRLYAVRLDRPAQLVPLRAACGRYVDWYTLGARRPRLPRI